MSNFTFHLPTKIIFGQAAAKALPDELAALAAKKVLLVSDAGLAALGMVEQMRQAAQAAGIEVTVFTAVSTNPTTDEVAAGLQLARTHQVDALVALGGGSPIDVAKGIAMLLANGGSYADYQWRGEPITQRSWPLLAVPTTAGTGSEVSKVAVISDPDNPFKKGVLSPLMFAHAAIVDATLTLGLPPALTAATGIDAFTHALEAFVGKRANPFTDQLALAAMQSVWTQLLTATTNGSNLAAREEMMLAALWGGMAMDHAGLGLIHALSGPLTSHLHLHHGLANAIIMPHVVGYNLSAVPEKRKRMLKQTLGLDVAAADEVVVATLRQFVHKLGLPTSLGELDVIHDGVDWDSIAEETTRMVLIHNNPRPATQADCLSLLEKMV